MNETIILEYPIEVKGIRINEISLRRPTVGDLLDAERGNADDKTAEIRLLANLAMMAPDEIKLLDLYDYGQLQAALGKFQTAQKQPSSAMQ